MTPHPTESGLVRRRQELVERIREQAQRSDDPALMALALQVSADRQVPDLHGVGDIALLEQEYSELRDVGQALQRIVDGTYGKCADCGSAIEPKRLDAYPSALCCVSCKAAFEGRRGIAATPLSSTP